MLRALSIPVARVEGIHPMPNSISLSFEIRYRSGRGSSSIGRTLILCFALIIFVSVIAAAQTNTIKGEIRIPDEQTIQIITLNDGSQIIGRIIAISENEIQFSSEMGEVNIEISKIRAIKETASQSLKKGKYWFENPNYSRLYFAPTGRMLKKGRAYFSDYYIFFPGIAVGVTDNITLGGGFSLFPGVDLEDQIYYFTPKIGLAASEKSSIAAGALIVYLPEIDDVRQTVGILYGVGTYGGSDGAISGGLGYGFVEGDFANKPAVMIGGEKRISRRVSFVSENWIFPGVDEPLISYGLRFFGEDISVDLGLINILGDDAIFPGMPWIDFVFNF